MSGSRFSADGRIRRLNWPRIRSSADTDLTNLRAGSLSAVLPPHLRSQAGARANLFGMTETFGPYCGDHLDTDLPPTKYGSCGRPFSGIEVAVFDPESGSKCPPGVDGEIAVRGPNVMRGICGRTRAETFDVDGYYHTGDLGNLDADGYLWYRGRRDDMFKVKGATVYPSEVEEALRGVDGVRQVFVTDVQGPAGRQVGALVVTAMTADVLDAEVRASLSSFKVPSLWYVTESLENVPRTASGKVDQPALRALLEHDGVTHQKWHGAEEEFDERNIIVTYETILYEVADRIATITFNRPHRYNAINEQMAKELNDAYGRAESDDEVWTLIVTATGKAFCSGADVEKIPEDGKAPHEGRYLSNYREWEAPQEATPPFRTMAKPIVVAVNGICCGAGMDLVTTGDISIAAEDATFFDPHVSIGLVAGREMVRVARTLPINVAMRMALLGKHERLSAQRAYDLGLITEVVAPDAARDTGP